MPLLSRIGPEYPWFQWKYTSNLMQRFCKEMDWTTFKGLISSGRNFHGTITQSAMFIGV